MFFPCFLFWAFRCALLLLLQAMSLGQVGMGLHKAAEEETKSLFVLCVSPRASYNKASGSISVGATGLCHRETHHITSLYMALAAALAGYHRVSSGSLSALSWAHGKIVATA
ncbi:hypothetical protein CI102_635 [Trichoderma harzianum]|uniref:Secreted protein n=1 Tax=Trichoderma harzianum CBS 226.95 TaxID=983964 RepID=A0A2T4AFB5_TRIHA|nr:hypothetical protein M431DRAFT_507425 [Trichoderma harzianum CBS 226.95]PKK54665.1 hypothetical protein CI102_635 [Trichoderma harzianum]PTB55767.1 hypothetical protein M431DRAFT_507425 [Trichoderma harzianum CBS 226.95]